MMKKMKRHFVVILYMLLCCTAMFFVSCSREHETDPDVSVQASLTLCLPAGDFSAVQNPSQRRVMGDPGLAERFLLPRYVYIFLLRQNGEQWNVYERIEDILDADSWEKSHYSGRLQSDGDTIYRYTRNVVYLLNNDRFNGRVYAIMSAKRLSFENELSSVETLDDVLNLRFDVSPDSIQQNLQHIYSSPYNYEVDGRYYGSFSSITSKSPVVNLLLYHVAAKVDMKWNVADTMRINNADPSQAVRLTSLCVRHLYDGWSYVFRPMENTLASMPTEGYEINNIVTLADEGLWWEGRYYFYTIPYSVSGNGNYFPLQLVMRTNNLAGDGYQVTINQPFEPASPFVPWVRADLRLSRPLTNTTATFTIDD